MKENEHGRLICEAAKAHLSPIGCVRKGRSRSWRSDQGFWLIGIEFQPSGFGRGSYLNVGACWLWNSKPYFSYDSGPGRIGQFIEFKTEDQFRPLVDAMAANAATAVLELRRGFRSIELISDALEERACEAIGWPVDHAAIAGHTEAGRRLFSRLDGERVSYPFEAGRRDDGRELAACHSAIRRRIGSPF